MGVFRLLTYLKEHQDEATVEVDLRQMAHETSSQGSTPAVLFCDFSNIVKELEMNVINGTVASGKQSHFSRFYGGHLRTLSAEFKSFILALKSTEVEPVFVLDGMDTCGPKSIQWSTTVNRYMQSLEKCDKWHQVCTGHGSSHKVPSMPHPFAVRCCKRVLIDTGCRFVQCQGEADGTLIALCCSTPGAIGILSNDTDFAIAKNCRFFPICLFDADSTVGFYNGQVKEDPSSITCRYTSDSILSECLGIRTEQVTDLAILCGNDYTKPLNAQYHLYRYIGCNPSTVISIAEWLQKLKGSLRENEKMKEFLVIHPDYVEALLASDATYLGQSTEAKVLPLVTEEEHIPQFNTLFKALEKGMIKRDFFAEDLSHGKMPVADQTLPIRRLTYSLLGVRKVKEYGRTCMPREFSKFGCCKVKSGQIMPDVQKHLQSTDIPLPSKAMCLYFLLANPQSASENLAALCQVTKHHDHPFSISSLPEHFSEDDYTCAVIALGIAKFANTVLHLYKEERLAVIIALLVTAAHGPPLYFSCSPKMRAVHLAALLCTTLNSALPLCQLLSLPASSCFYEDIFDSSIFVAVYMAVCTGSKDNESLRRILSLCEKVQDIPAVEVVLTLIASVTDLDVCTVSDAAKNFMEAVYYVKNEIIPEHKRQLASIQPAPLTSPTYRHSSDEAEEGIETHGESHSSATTSVKLQSQPVKTALASKQKYSTEELPIMKHKQEIVELIANHKVSIIEGQTGSGKSTQVPQFILDHAIEMQRSHRYPCKIIVTQPRRMAAKTLAKRVSKERNEPLNRTVGYRIGGEHSGDKSNLKITFVTSGWLLRFLTGNPKGIKQYTHIILDEVHDRSTEADFLCLVVRNLLVKPDCLTKVILMSATLEDSLYSQYFQEKGLEVSGPLVVHGRQFPVKEYFLDDVANPMLRLRKEEHTPDLVSLGHQARGRAAKESMALVKNSDPQKKLRYGDPRIAICCDLIFSEARLGEATLVFVPGFDELMTVYEAVSSSIAVYDVGTCFQVFLLHSQVPMSEQKEAFEEPADNIVRILLATNVAESSLTIPKLRLVINFCLCRGIRYDSILQMSMLDLNWCSHASCKQRAGRAGRIFPGVAIHLVPERFHDEEFPLYDAPEMRTASVPRVYLEAKNLSNYLPFGGPTELLMDTLTPPSDMHVIDAVRELHNIGAISAKSEEGDITLLGYLGLKLSVDLSLCRLILLGICFDCPDAAIIMAAGLSMRQDVFSTPLPFMKEYPRSLWLSAKTRWEYDHGQYSEPHMYVKLFSDWMEFKQEKRKSNLRNRVELARGFAKGKGLSWERLLQLESSVGDIARRTKTFVPQECNLYAQLDKLSKLIRTTTYAVPRWAGVITDNAEVVKIHSDPVTCKTLLVAAFNHNLLIGRATVLEHDTKAGKKTREVMEEAGAEGIALKDQSTLYMCPFNQAEKYAQAARGNMVIQPVTKADDLLQVAQGIVQERKHIDTRLFPKGRNYKKMIAVVKFHASFKDNPKTEHMRKHEGESQTESSTFSNFPSEVIAPDAMLRCDAIVTWQFGLRRPAWNFGNIHNMPRVQHPCSVAFNLVSKDRTFVLADGWRNPVGVACDVKNIAPFYAVAANLISFSSISKASGMCILPRLGKGATAVHPLLMILAFLDFHRTVKFCRVEGDPKRFSAIEIDGYELRCPADQWISLAQIMMINRVRKALSEVMSHTFSNHSYLPIEQMAYIRQLICSLFMEDTDIDVVYDNAGEELGIHDEEQHEVLDRSDSPAETDTESEDDLVEGAGLVKSHLWPTEHWNTASTNQFPLYASVVPPGATLVQRVQREDPRTHCLTARNELLLTVSGTLPHIEESTSVPTSSIRYTGESEDSSDEDSDS